VVTRPRQGRRALPLLAWLSPDDVVEAGDAILARERERRFPCDAGAITATACAHFTGTSYLWGGITPWGADCSGLVQSSFALHGLDLPRDAWQQAECGRDAGTDFAALAPADLLFFSDRADRRITHVGMALGGSRMVHLALNRGGYRVEQLDDLDDAFVCKLRERFLLARRLLP
jgi:cell wall-associated NlpC family hydrolase